MPGAQYGLALKRLGNPALALRDKETRHDGIRTKAPRIDHPEPELAFTVDVGDPKFISPILTVTPASTALTAALLLS